MKIFWNIVIVVATLLVVGRVIPEEEGSSVGFDAIGRSVVFFIVLGAGGVLLWLYNKEKPKP